MKKIVVAILILTTITSIALAETITAVSNTDPVADSPVVILDEPNKIGTLPQPYEDICIQLSNGKESVLRNLSIAVVEKIQEPEAKILESLGAAAAKQYTGDPLLGMAKFCRTLDCWETFDAQLKAAAAFAKGYKSCGIAVIPADCIEGDPQTKLEMHRGNFAWFIPFKSGTNFTVTILGKKDVTARVWKILGDMPVSKEWQGGFWEREIRIQGK